MRRGDGKSIDHSRLLILMVLLVIFIPSSLNSIQLCQTRGNEVVCKNSGLTWIESNSSGTYDYTILHLEGNNYERLEENETFKTWTGLTVLRMINCNVHLISDDLFKPLRNLEELILQDNKLTFNIGLNAKAFQPLRKLKKLVMNNNPLGSVPDYFFQYLHNLKCLHLANSDGGLMLNDRSFHGLRSLKLLNITSNSLRTLSESIFEDFNVTQLKKILLGGNKWHCDCKLRWLQTYASKIKSYFPDKPKCFSPPSMKNVEIAQSPRVGIDSSNYFPCDPTVDLKSNEEMISSQAFFTCYLYSNANISTRNVMNYLHDIRRLKPTKMPTEERMVVKTRLCEFTGSTKDSSYLSSLLSYY